MKKGGFVVFIVSTTGEGEPPDTIRKFWRILKDKSLNSDILSGLLYALLGNKSGIGEVINAVISLFGSYL